MVGGLTRRILPYLSGVPHLHVNRPLDYVSWYISDSLSCRHEQPCGQYPWYENCLHCSSRPGEWPGAPPLSYLRVSMNAVPPPPPPLSEGLYPPLLLRQRVAQKHIRYVAIHFQDQRDAAWLRYRACAEITVWREALWSLIRYGFRACVKAIPYYV